eukprot:scaffold79773_cov47-Prasinocladus_malaysianus.AAC.1
MLPISADNANFTIGILRRGRWPWLLGGQPKKQTNADAPILDLPIIESKQLIIKVCPMHGSFLRLSSLLFMSLICWLCNGRGQSTPRPTFSQHASTVIELEFGELLAAWFGGSWEGNDDIGIWLSRYKVGKEPENWEGRLKRSGDYGATWGPDEILPFGIFGPVKNSPIILPDGTILAGSGDE